MNIPKIPENSPFSTEQQAWLSGFIAAIAQVQPNTPSSTASTPTIENKAPITIIWGSQTGNAESLAKKTSKTLSKSGFEPKVVNMADYSFEEITNEKNILIITSTYGDGEPPDNAQPLHEALMAAEEATLTNTQFAVFGLGDSEYPDFCQCSKEFDSQLEKLGAKRLLDAVECDVDFDDEFTAWTAALALTLA